MARGDPVEAAKAYAMKLLAARGKSEAELRRRLEQKGFEAGVVDAAMVRLKELRFVDDEAFATARAESLSKRLAPAAVEKRLESQGVAEAVARRAASQAQGERSELGLARECLATRRPKVDRESLPADRARAARWLAGRGFSEEVVTELLGEEG
ncbi:MAG: regulatory protein RecX [Deltaproteobacteria bacterium]|nr:regulatory protein RecX [Deltaproteobacteria bacterium]